MEGGCQEHRGQNVSAARTHEFYSDSLTGLNLETPIDDRTDKTSFDSYESLETWKYNFLIPVSQASYRPDKPEITRNFDVLRF